MANEIGRRTLRVLTILLIVVVVLFIALLALTLSTPEGLGDNPVLQFAVSSAAISLGVLALMLVIAPGVAFLIHSVKHRDRGITARLRYSATAAALVPGLFGAMLVSFGGERVGGWVFVAVALAVLARAWTMRRADSDADAPTLAYKYSVVGMIVVALAGAMNPHGHSMSSSYVTAMKSDLRNLMGAQEDYFTAHKRYSTDVAALGFRKSTDVSEPRIVVGPDWWHATNTHARLTGRTCGIAIKTKNPVADTADGVPACK